MIFKLLFIFLVSFPGFHEASQTEIQQVDSSKVEVRRVDNQSLQELTSEPVFAYNEIPQNPDSLLSRLQRWIIQLLQFLFQNPWAEVLIKFLFFAIFAIVLIALINHILGGNISSAFTGSKSGESISLNISEQQLSDTNYDELLQKAITEKRYADAVRIIYLKSLQELSENKLISWKPDKTNHDYLNEIQNHPVKTYFSRLTYFYEFVEYGDFTINQEAFSSVSQSFQKFQDKLGPK